MHVINDKSIAWKRLSARGTDYVVFSLLLGAPPINSALHFLDNYGVLVNALFYLCVIPLIYIPFEATQLWIFRRTIGKYFVGLMVVKQGGGPIPFMVCFKRSILVYWRGMAAAVPFVEFVALYLAYRKFTRIGGTSWDRDLNTDVVSIN